jgi:hypothetical protein
LNLFALFASGHDPAAEQKPKNKVLVFRGTRNLLFIWERAFFLYQHYLGFEDDLDEG